jgi:glycosyltransferase involved in cell wall biosynthesis
LEPIISIVAPNLDEMPYLKTWFIKSLKEQTFKDFECIIVDGGSKDQSIPFLEELTEKDTRFHYVIDETRNIGYVRNIGAKITRGKILFETSSDIYFPKNLLMRLVHIFTNKKIIAVSGMTRPTGKIDFITHLAYGGFDFLRFLFTCRFMPIKKMRPAGNFLAIRKNVFDELGGYPEVKINEDGLFGMKLDEYLKNNPDMDVQFRLNLNIFHHVKRFEKKGGIKGLLFYIYVFGLLFPFLRPILRPIELRSAKEFSTRTDLK